MTGIFSVSLACKYCYHINLNNLVPNDREIYYKETTSKKYKSMAYLIAKIIIEAGSVIVGTILFALGDYYIVGYTGDGIKLVRFSNFL